MLFRALGRFIRLLMFVKKVNRQNVSIGDLFEQQVEKNPNKACLVLEGREWSFKEVINNFFCEFSRVCFNINLNNFHRRLTTCPTGSQTSSTSKDSSMATRSHSSWRIGLSLLPSGWAYRNSALLFHWSTIISKRRRFITRSWLAAAVLSFSAKLSRNVSYHFCLITHWIFIRF